MAKKLNFTLLTAALLLANFCQAQWTTSQLSVGRFNLAATSAGNKVLFGGGIGTIHNPEDTSYTRVDIYNTTTNSWSTAELSAARGQLAAASTSTKAFFGGGLNKSMSSAAVDVYDDATSNWSKLSLSQPRRDLAAAAVGNKVFFAGGFDSFTGYSKVIDIWDDDAGTWSVDSLSEARSSLVAVASGTKIYFAGGFINTAPWVSNTIDIYDVATKTWSKDTLSLARGYLSATAIGSKIIFAGGRSYLVSPADAVTTIDIFDTNTGKWSRDNLSQGRSFIAVANNGTVAFFGGGYPPGTFASTVDIYDNTTGKWSIGALSVARANLAAASAGNVIVFGGGSDANGLGNVVDIYNPVCPLPLISATKTTLCQGDSTTLTASGSSTYTWTGPGLSTTTGATVVAKPLASNNFSTFTYTVQGAPTSGCTPSGSVSITVDNPLPPNVSPDSTLCLGASAKLRVNGMVSYQWSPSAGLSSETGSLVTATPTATTTYQVTGTDVYGCTASASVTLSVDNITKPIVGTTHESNGFLLAISSSTLKCQWFRNSSAISGANDFSFLATTLGSYTVQTTDDKCFSPMSDAFVMPVTTSVNTQPEGNSWIYPIPAGDNIYFDWSEFDAAQEIQLTVVDLAGKVQYIQHMLPTTTRLNVSFLSSGLYIIVGRQGSYSAVAKLVKR